MNDNNVFENDELTSEEPKKDEIKEVLTEETEVNEELMKENIPMEKEVGDSTYVQTSEQIIDNTVYTVENGNQNPDKVVQSENLQEPKKKNNIGLCVGLIVLAILIIGALSLGTKYLVQKKNNENIKISTASDENKDAKVKTEEKQVKDNETEEVKTNSGSTVADIVDNVMPSIVSIACTVSQEYSFFGRSYSEDAQGSGSGIIIGQNDKQVYIATNNHVIDGANTVIITFNDEEDVKAEIKGTDSSNDLAVVAVDIADLKDSTKRAIKVASLGKSENCKVGEMAVAIGNALGYGQSVTVGVISALNREISSEDYTMSLIQTDAAINPGNSGGALLNSKGEVIGINSVKYVSEDTEGMGYAIPITEAIEILNDLMNYEEIPERERAYLGIIGYDIDKTFSQRSNIPEGVYIQEISDKAPAAKSGLKVGDVIVKFDGKKVATMENLQNIMKNKKGGDKVEVVVMRASNGQYGEKTITVTFGARGEYVD